MTEGHVKGNVRVTGNVGGKAYRKQYGNRENRVKMWYQCLGQLTDNFCRG